MSRLLEVRDLKTYFFLRKGVVKAVDGVSFDLDKGEALGIVGESGSGKTVTALSIMRLVPYPGRIVDGEIKFKGRDLLSLSEDEMRKIRGKEISMIFQDPHNSLNPVYNVGWQVGEAIELHTEGKPIWSRILDKVISILRGVGIPKVEERIYDYPHQFSGGQKQRIMIGMSVSNNPDLIIADEPTTALDVTIQAQIIDLLKELRHRYGSSIMLITHNMGLVAELCDRIAVMYSGKVVEYGDINRIFEEPLHPYTQLLLECIPRTDRDVDRLMSIPGEPPDPISPPRGCRFHPRCPYAKDGCRRDDIYVYRDNDHMVSCELYR